MMYFNIEKSRKMAGIYLSVLLLVFQYSEASRQYIPCNNCNVNATHILLEYPEIKNAEYYQIKLKSKESNSKEELFTFLDSSTVCGVNVLSFGKKYEWKVFAFGKNKTLIDSSQWLNFSVPYSDFIDTSKIKIKLNNYNKEKTDDGIIWLDNMRIAIDRNGKPVWFLPQLPSFVKQNAVIRDLKISCAGTLTYMADTSALEVNLNGELLWKAPNNGKVSGEKSEYYHHDLRRLKNGNYMTLGKYFQRMRSPEMEDTTTYNVEMGTILEYNPKGELVWFWNAKDYLSTDDIFKKNPDSKSYDIATHMNAFSIDEEKGYVYAGFRNLHRVIKIDKKKKKVVDSYGKKYPRMAQSVETTFLCFSTMPIFSKMAILLYLITMTWQKKE